MRLKPVVSVAGLAALAACQGGDIEELKKGQKDILAKLDSLDKSVQQVNAAAPAARPPGQDPNKVYTIPVADSPVRGPKTAKVTIVEFPDFQRPLRAQSASLVDQVLQAYPSDADL